MQKIIRTYLVTVAFLAVAFLPVYRHGEHCQAKSVVQTRLAEVVKQYPQNSKFKGDVSVNGFSGGGCNGLVMYATLKIFHNAYDPSVDTFRQVGKTASTKSQSKMRSLFGKARVGDVIRWRKGYTDSHFAIFLSANAGGVYVYEANFGPRDKVWYRHFWAWKNMKTWPAGGADKVNVYRSRNYNQVNKKTAAQNYKVGKEFTVSGLRYRVTKANAISGTVKFIGYEAGNEGKKVPKYLYVNKDTGENVNSNEESYGSSAKTKGRNVQIVYTVKK